MGGNSSWEEPHGKRLVAEQEVWLLPVFSSLPQAESSKKQPDPNRAAYLKASRVDDFIAYGALHKHDVELAFLFLHCILLSCFATHEAHGSVGQHRLEARKNS